MSYFFRCTYCNHEEEVDPWEPEKGLNCADCGEDICALCCYTVKGDKLCTTCATDERMEDQ